MIMPPVSANLDLVRSIYATWERGDYFTSTDWADPEIEFVVMGGLNPGALRGVAARAAKPTQSQGGHRMKLHANAALSLNRRRLFVLAAGQLSL